MDANEETKGGENTSARSLFNAANPASSTLKPALIENVPNLAFSIFGKTKGWSTTVSPTIVNLEQQ
jgi:hypothetical protein